MKKIFKILILMLFSTTVFGQVEIGDRSSIEYDHWSDWTNITHFYSEYNSVEFKYILAYEPNFPRGVHEGTKRKIYLYCVRMTQDADAKFRSHYDWVRVSDVVFEAYYNSPFDFKEYSFYMSPDMGKSNVKVEGKFADKVTFTVDVYQREPNGNDYTYSNYQESITLELKNVSYDGNFYNVKND